LQHITLDLPAGPKTAIVGPSGSGKSALFHLLLKIYAADSGSMNIAGKSSDTIKDEDLWKQSRAVLQENHFFNGTIRSNLQLAGDDLTHADMSTALRHVQLQHFSLSDTVYEIGSNIYGVEHKRQSDFLV